MKLVCLGAVPHAVKIYNRIKEKNNNLELLGFIDNDEKKWGKKVLSFPVFGGTSKVPELTKSGAYFCNLVTHDAITRYETCIAILEKGAKLTNFIHPDIDLEYVTIGTGNYIQENISLQANVTIGNNSSIHTGTQVGHETKIGDSVFIAHGCNLSGAVQVEDGVFIGTGVTVMPRIRIGKWSVIGAGSVIISDIPPYSVVIGNPGRVIKNLDKKYISGQIFKTQ